jgi:anaerobic dimethyl sulfoxide reductase subunit B (iron-sulfur subunit)
MSETMLFIIDLDRCWGCSTCVTACAIEKNTTPEFSAIAVTSRESVTANSLDKVFLPALCQQCEEAECMKACPTDALVRNNDGTISVINELCIGCRACEKKCPFGAITVDRQTKKAVKCDMCLERREMDGNPACVHHCIGGCLSVMKESEYISLNQETNTLRKGNIVYTSEKYMFD